ncbi:MAG: nucleoside 2-deoxyribosyltransferase [Ilumatobacteraceae bacterium]
MTRIYWANGLFTEAQRAFNAEWAHALRLTGYEVFLPQELDANDPSHSPESWEIFHADTQELLDCDVLVAVVDDETIDSGVATEIGLAYGAGIPVVGVYTDIRRNRESGRMYKNLYVLGLLESSLGVVHSQEELARVLSDHLAGGGQIAAVSDDVHRSDRLAQLDQVIGRLENSYAPRWSSYDSVIALLERGPSTRMIDFGCGTGRLAQRMSERSLQHEYLGYDVDSSRIAEARARGLDAAKYDFTDSYPTLLERVRSSDSPTALNASFVLHDMTGLADLRAIGAFLSGSSAIIHDLAADDLPGLMRIMSLALGALPDPRLERRFSIARLSQVCERLGLEISSLEPIRLEVTFDSPDDVMDYCHVFGLLAGADLPIPARMPVKRRYELLNRQLERVNFPLVDQRLFVRILGVLK